MRGGSIALAAAGVLGAFGTAHASLLWDFTTSADGPGSGTLTTGPLSGGSYTITGITGTFGGKTITGLVNYFSPDDLLYPASQYLDTHGVSFSLSDGESVNLFGEGFGFFSFDASGGAAGPGTFAAFLAPEPGTFGILATALAALPLLRRRRRQEHNV